jgi:glycosyltransferase involved in cell wall biosynthesis
MVKSRAPWRVLFVTSRYHPLTGGVEAQSEHLARTLASRGQPVDILTAKVQGSPEREVRSGVTVYRSIRTLPLHGLWGASHFFGALFFLLRRGQPYRVVLCYQLQSFYNAAAIAWGKLWRRPVVVCGASTGELSDLAVLGKMTARRPLRTALGGAAAYVALSEVMEQEMVRAGLSRGKIRIIPNGVDTELFAPAAAEGAPRRGIVYVGRLSPEKGVTHLLGAFALLAADRPGLVLRLYGEGPEEASLRKKAESLGLKGRVEFAGAVGAMEVREALGTAEVVVQPSLVEGISCALLEAMAMECAVVTTDIPANRSVMRDGEEGLLVPTADPAALAEGAGRLLDDREAAARLGKAARRRARERFSMESVARRYGDLFREISGPGGKA